MMGTRHAALGILGAAVALPLAAPAGAPLPLWVAAWVGGSLLPDLDMGSSHAGRVWGWPTRWVGALIGEAAGGHRARTHDIIAAPAAVCVAGWALLVWRPLAVFAVAYILGLALRMAAPYTWRPLRRPIPNVAVSLAAAWMLLSSPQRLWWGPPVIAAAVALHVVADSLTNEGAPAPLGRRGDWGLRILTCGRGIEPLLGAVFAAAAGAITWHHLSITSVHA